MNIPEFAHHVIENLARFGGILQVFAIAGGLGLFMTSLFEFKRYGETRTFMSQQLTIARPLMLMMGGVMLLIMPTLIGTFMLAFWGSANPLAYQPANNSGWEPLVPVIIAFVRLVGVGSFMRGIFLISRTGGAGHSQPGTLMKAVLHMFGGVLCINIVATEQLLRSILPI